MLDTGSLQIFANQCKFASQLWKKNAFPFFLVKWVYHKLYIFQFQTFDTNWPSLIYKYVSCLRQQRHRPLLLQIFRCMENKTRGHKCMNFLYFFTRNMNANIDNYGKQNMRKWMHQFFVSLQSKLYSRVSHFWEISIFKLQLLSNTS